MAPFAPIHPNYRIDTYTALTRSENIIVATDIDAKSHRATLIRVDISFDPAKRATTLENRGLDFADAGLVFAGHTATVQDTRKDYGEDRFITAGHLAEQCVVLVWTPRGESRRIISMRHAHADEERAWFP